MRRLRTTTAALLTAGLLLAGCGGSDEEPEATPAESPAAETEAPPVPETEPFTGEEASDKVRKHPAFVVKIDNTAASAPQVGLSKSDLVVEQMVEGGLTRLAVVYYSQLPAEVGPVRSMRATDIGIAAPAEASLVASGGAGVTIDRIRKAGIPIIEEGAKGISRSSARRAPYNVMANLKDVAAGKTSDGRPADYFDFAAAGEAPAANKAAKTVRVRYPSRSTDWVFEGGTYRNSNSFAAQGDQFQADNVLVLRVRQGDAGYTDPAGNPVPESIFNGKGKAWLFHGGKMVPAKWSKDGLDGKVALTSKGSPLALPQGRTWLHLLPQANTSVNFE